MSAGAPDTVAVVGAGISGLAAAYRLRALLPDARLTVLDAGERIGGKLRTATLGGRPFDVGAEAFLVRRPEVLDLAAELDLPVVHPTAARASILARGVRRAIPAGTVQGVPSSADAVAEVLTAEATARVAAEPSLPPVTSVAGRTVGGLLRERGGDEVVEKLVDPLLGGVYASGADTLGLRATMPALAEAIERHGHVLPAAGSLLPAAASGAPVFGAVRGGYAALTGALAAQLDVRCGVTVRSLSREGGRWRLDTGARGTDAPVYADAVLLAVPAPPARDLLRDACPVASAALGRVELASIAVIGLAYPEDVRLPDASGVLIAAGETHADGTPFTAKAFTFSSRKWDHLGPGLLRASVGRFGEAASLRRTDAELVCAVRADLAELARITESPVDTVVARWGGGLPQYGPGHVELVGEAETAVATLPGLEIAGAALHGVGVPACIATATSAAERLAGRA
jgi:oxygen-dependent protoporphyrinogen oxidase